ncbi:alpha-1D adrenergic receptor isoform X2 [Paramormyrops kingsleyae]|uniref:alpha-1D adrenergic receptor isoform X2 n=1 Tax=Paramormyrops kingsleyae TaxID=1676925 RepID=UPI000CD64542|nr:alpha-1D adrenergic receptor isoform X2 [Paramormyrops kingsleyae]
MTRPNPMNESYGGIYTSNAVNLSFLDQLFANISNTTCTNLALHTEFIAVGVFLSVFILIAIVGNILVILSVVCNRHLQTVTNFFIVNLAIADLLLSIIVLPFSATLEVLGCWVFGRVFCNIWAAVDVLCCTASIMSLCIISIDRVYVVARRTTKSLEAGVKRERNKSMEVVLRIHCRSVLEESAASAKSKNHPFRSSVSVRLMKFSREKKAAKTLAIVVGVFILCWLPFFFVLPLGSFFPALKPSEMVFKVIFWLGYFNSCINPIIYPCSSKEFQRAFTRLLRCQCHRRKRVLRRFYDQRWRTAVRGSGPSPQQGSGRDGCGDYRTGFSLHGSCSGSLLCKGGTFSLKAWNLFPPLQKSSFQLKEKMNSLSSRIRNGPGKGATPGLGRAEIDTVSMAIYNDCSEQCTYQMYELGECYSLKETDI